MFIRVNLRPEPATCSYIYAWSADSNDETPSCKFLHTWNSDSFQEIISVPQPCDDDFYITLKSDVNYKEWTKAVKTSEYNFAKNYRLLTHNCKSGANFALQTANIDVFKSQGPVIFNRLYSIPVLKQLCRPPLGLIGFTTPHDLYDCTKAFKLQQLSSTKTEIQYTLTQAHLRFCVSAFAAGEEAKLVIKIADEIQARHRRHPEHTEHQIEVLKQTLLLITELATDAKCDGYKQSSEQFRQRAITQAGTNRNFLFVIWCLSWGSIAGVLVENSKKLFNATPKLTSLQSLAIAAPSLIGLFAIKRMANTITLKRLANSTKVPTELSEHMEKLAELRRPKKG